MIGDLVINVLLRSTEPWLLGAMASLVAAPRRRLWYLAAVAALVLPCSAVLRHGRPADLPVKCACAPSDTQTALSSPDTRFTSTNAKLASVETRMRGLNEIRHVKVHYLGRG